MIHICSETLDQLAPVEVFDFFDFLTAHHRGFSAYLHIGDDKLSCQRGVSMPSLNGKPCDPHTLCRKFANHEGKDNPNTFDWNHPMISPIVEIVMIGDSYTAFGKPDPTENDPHNIDMYKMPLSGVQRMFSADPTRFVEG